MFNTKEFYSADNAKIEASYHNTIIEIKDILKETEECCGCEGKKEFAKFANHVAKFILKLSDLEKNICNEYFKSKTFEELKQENYSLYEELLPENYKTSYANPALAVSIFGDKLGQLISAIYVKFRMYINYAYRNKIFKMESYNRLFINIFNYVKNNKLDYEALRKMFVETEAENIELDSKYRVLEGMSGDFDFLTDIAVNSDLSDLRYMFRYGEYISENEIRTAEFLAKYPKQKLDTLSDAVAKAYVNGFVRDNKDITKKSTVRILSNIGQERMIANLFEDYKKRNLRGFISLVWTTEYNKQYAYDHRFDNALFFDEAYAKKVECGLEKYCELYKAQLSKYSGPMVFEKFGEEPFAPENKKECLKLSEEQAKLMQGHRNNQNQIFEKYVPANETSFCIIAFPTPEIGDKFEQIYEDITTVNMLDSSKYEKIQQHIINALDKADYVHVKGSSSNKTDIKVKLHELKKPEKETNFENCVADVNIPVGEVFTSPLLTGTNGVLHLDEVFLGDLKYIDLKITFKDGYTEEYTCKNFDNEEDNKKYILENLLFPHKKLPLGEFAIGTNTFAYVMARKYNIVNLLPILIVEKMGPHFAIGDTCFSWSEDTPVYNFLDKKEIIARDNERSLLRKTNINEAYTNKHTDITLPYDALEFITAITKTGEKIDIIRNGRFVLEGTEELNEPFSK